MKSAGAVFLDDDNIGQIGFRTRQNHQIWAVVWPQRQIRFTGGGIGMSNMKSFAHKSCVIAMFAALTACSTQPGAILRELNLNEGTSYTTGARQRVVSNIKPGIASRPGQVDPLRIICVEPSPDVAIAVANSFGAGLSILGQGRVRRK